MDKNMVIYGDDMSSSVDTKNKEKGILILGEGPTQEIDDITLTAQAKYSINVIQSRKRFVLRLHYNGNKSFLLANATKTCQFKTKDSQVKDYTLNLGNISKYFTINDMKNSGFTGSVKLLSY